MLTELTDKSLWYDGSYTLTDRQLADRLLQHINIDNCFIDNYTKYVDLYNLISSKKIDVKYCNNELDTSWNIPEKYLNIDLREYCISRSDYKNNIIKNRIDKELDLVKDAGLTDLFRSIIYILDYFKSNNIIWGVGRGSSCASYLLFIIGLHSVDCIKYNIDEKEFFKNE